MDEATTAGIYSVREAQFARQPGTGGEATTKEAWYTEIGRDTAACVLGNFGMLLYLSAARGQSLGQTRMQMTRELAKSCKRAKRNA